jgi:hypothetical protein
MIEIGDRRAGQTGVTHVNASQNRRSQSFLASPSYQETGLGVERKARRRFKQTVSLEGRRAEEAKRLRKEARGIPPGIARERLLRKAQELDTTMRLSEWISTPHAVG